MAVRRTRITASVDHDRGVFMISVAAELAEMHPQTLRMYEARGLIEPKRSPKGTRLYSHADVQRLRRIQALTSDAGMNLAGVEKVFELEAALARMQRKVGQLERRGARAAGRDRAARGGQALGQVRDRPLRGGLDRPRAAAGPSPPGRRDRLHQRRPARGRGAIPSAPPSWLGEGIEQRRQRLCIRSGRIRRRPAATARRVRRGNRKPRRRSREVRGAAGACCDSLRRSRAAVPSGERRASVFS